MKIELKSIKHMSSLSEETPCYSATLYIDGVRIGGVSNHGQGGPDDCDFGWNRYQEISKKIEATFPPEPFSYTGADGQIVTDHLKASLEGECHKFVIRYLEERELRRLLKTKTLFQKGGETALYEIKGSVPSAAIFKKYPDAVVLNDLPFEAALKVFREAR